MTSTRIDGKKILVEADRAKTKSSLRTLPLVDPIAERLKAVKEQQEYNQKICGNCYNQEYLGYVFVDAMGNLIQPDSVTTGFPQLLKENGLRRIRFHDLRHPYVKPTTKNNGRFKAGFMSMPASNKEHLPNDLSTLAGVLFCSQVASTNRSWILY